MGVSALTKQDIEMVRHLLKFSPSETAISNVAEYLREKDLTEKDFIVVLTLVDGFLYRQVLKSRIRFRLSASALAISIISFVVSFLNLFVTA